MLFNTDLETVTPVSPVAPYLGGKRGLARRICTLVEDVPHKVYAEPFVGMGGIFFRRVHRPKSEIINDVSGDVHTFFRILQRHYPQFIDTLKFQITSRREFERLQNTDPKTLTDLERAARFLYLQRTAFGGKVTGRNYAMDRSGRGGRMNLTKLIPMLEDVHERLAGVQIESLDFGKFIEIYDGEDVLFYLDPPYYGNENDYGQDFSRSDFERLAALLRELKGRFILSLNDRPEVREIFAEFDFTDVTLKYTVAAGASVEAKEVIIRDRPD